MLTAPVLGRGDELAAILDCWDALPTRPPTWTGPRVAVIQGEAGLGKTTLVGSVINALNSQPHRVLNGHCRLHSPAPYDWLATILCAHPQAALSVPDDARAWLSQDPDVPADRYTPAALLRLAERAVRELVDRGPALVIAEDLHALDPASLSLLTELVSGPALPALLLVTTRPASESVAPDLAARTLARLSSAPDSLRLGLKPLATGDIRALLTAAYRQSIDERLAESVRQRIGGNPYHLGELLASGPVDPVRLVEAPSLTVRETQVLACLAEGWSNKQVARALGISIRTVAVHVSNLLRKTGSASRTEAALWAVSHRRLAPSRVG